MATLKLGERTTTGDAEGEVIQTRPVRIEGLAPVLERFKGQIEQVPPMHSALKHKGTPLYRLARRGEEVARAPREVRIAQLEVLESAPPRLVLRVVCSKGTYVRTLAEDIGEALGCGAHLAGLRRTGSGRFRVEDARGLDALDEDCVLPLPALVEGLARVELTGAQEVRLRQGQVLQISGLHIGLCAVVRSDGGVIGLAEADAHGTLKPLRLTQGAEKHLKSAPQTKRES